MRYSTLWLCLLCWAGCQCEAPPVDDDGGAFGGAGGRWVGDGGRPDAGPADAGLDAGTSDAGALDASIDLGACQGVTWPAPNGCTAASIEGRLACIPGLTVQQTGFIGGRRAWALGLVQPVDHHDPDAGVFTQHAFLMEGDPGAPTVLATTGYQLWPYTEELADVFGANQLTYEHRYFGASRPAPVDWRFLTIEQSAEDAHQWALALRWALPGRWVSAGGSKGGMTSVYHRRFFPCDVEATVAYVAPVSYGPLDPDYAQFLADAGGPTWAGCRDALTQFQRRLLLARGRLAQVYTVPFTRVGGADRAFELAVVELPFGFWQYGSPSMPTYGCADIPPAGATDAQMLVFLDYHSSVPDLASDPSLATYEAYYYQAATQLGAPAPSESLIADLLLFPGADVAATYAPVGVPLPFDAAAMPDVNQWVSDAGERLMLIYGEWDPWSTHEIPLGAARDSARYLVAGGNHFARVGALSAQDKDEAMGTLERWFGQRRRFTPQALYAPTAPPRRAPR